MFLAFEISNAFINRGWSNVMHGFHIMTPPPPVTNGGLGVVVCRFRNTE